MNIPSGPGLVVQCEQLDLTGTPFKWVTVTPGPDRCLTEIDAVIRHYARMPIVLVTKSLLETQAAWQRWSTRVILAPFNEPDAKDQANMTPQQVVYAYQKLVAAGIPFVGPGLCSLVWSPDWWTTFEALGGPKLCNALNIHSYGLSPADYAARAADLSKTWGRPVFAAEGGTGAAITADFVRQAIACPVPIGVFQGPNDPVGVGLYDRAGNAWKPNAVMASLSLPVGKVLTD